MICYYDALIKRATPLLRYVATILRVIELKEADGDVLPAHARARYDSVLKMMRLLLILARYLARCQW